MGPNETSKLFHSKRNHQQSEKTTYGMGENICKPYCWERVKYIKNSHNSIAKNQIIQLKKRAKGPSQTFFQKRYTDGQQVNEMMLNTTRY